MSLKDILRRDIWLSPNRTFLFVSLKLLYSTYCIIFYFKSLSCDFSSSHLLIFVCLRLVNKNVFIYIINILLIFRILTRLLPISILPMINVPLFPMLTHLIHLTLPNIGFNSWHLRTIILLSYLSFHFCGIKDKALLNNNVFGLNNISSNYYNWL